MTTRHPLPPRGPTHWAEIEGLSPRALAHAREGCAQIAPVLRVARASVGLVTIDINAPSKRRRITLSGWIIRARHLVEVDLPVAAATTERIGSAFADLFHELRARWPENARPKALSFASDGVGLMFNRGAPNGENGAWLVRHLDGTSPASLLLPGADLARFCANAPPEMTVIQGGKMP